MPPSAAPTDCLDDYLARAVPLVLQAGAELERLRADRLRPEFKGRRELVTAADRAAERIVVEGLLHAFPDHGVLAEEGELTPRGASHRAGGDWTWILDPLDGTTNYVHDLPNYAVSLALAWRGEPVLGVVHAPAAAATYSARLGGGAFRDGVALRVTATVDLADALLATGFSYDRNEPGVDDNSGRLARMLPACRDLRRFGSAALDLCLVADGRFDGYWELGLAPYDVAAGAVLVREAGGRVTDLAGGGGWLHGRSILASNGALHDAMRAVVGDPR